ncbi:MAG TPA: TrpB-like pyridoxal phosphate-dependent enzyme [Gemmatimonadaceae bacterium]|jgi:tryptophan synthase beta chain|nr:TrpB-like pyridoxal phosphate-dependent enzyme [Gemmatimonadaceae bacterium]
MSERHQYHLDESRLPKAWYNINADMPVPRQPMLHPGTMEPVTPDFLSVLLPMALIQQEVSTERYVDIPEPVREIYRLWRPTPLMRAVRLEKLLDTPAHIYYKYEGVSPVGSHKPNTAVPQAFYNKEAGARAMVTETGAGQWGSALAMACNFFGMDVEIFMVKISHTQKPYRRIIMENYGATVYASPTDRTHAGRAALALDPSNPGVLGLAISESVETVATSGGTKKYAPGSSLGFVLMHQTVIGQEALEQMEMAGEYPDFVIGCAGGGSSFGGFAFPFVHQNLTNGKKTRIIAVEPASCPSMTQGTYAYDWSDHARTTPIAKMYTLGHGFIPPEIHAGGLRYHGMAPSVSALVHNGDIEARAVSETSTFAAAVQFSRAEGIIPAPESAHAIRVAIDEALACKLSGEKRVIVFNMSGHGHFDMMAYQAYHAGEMHDDAYSASRLEEALAELPQVQLT